MACEVHRAQRRGTKKGFIDIAERVVEGRNLAGLSRLVMYGKFGMRCRWLVLDVSVRNL